MGVHGLLVMLLLLEDEMILRDSPLPRRLMGMWIHLPRPTPHEEPVALPQPSSTTRADRAPAVAPITLAQDQPAPSEPTAPTGPAAPPRVDWRSEAASVAALIAREKEGPPKTFSGPVEKMREPCKPAESSFKMKSRKKEEPEPSPPSWTEMVGPPRGSVMMGGTRVGIIPLVGGGGGIGWLTLGWEEPEPDKHYFDDMKAGKNQVSSVPDPNVCD